MNTKTATAGLEILKPMHEDFEKYMFEPVVGGMTFSTQTNIPLSESSVETLKLNWYQFYKRYLPTWKQLWAEVLRFNDGQKYRSVAHFVEGKELSIYYKSQHTSKKIQRYTDTDSMYLALLKICVEIWKIEQGDV